jgi:hypothetical protein
MKRVSAVLGLALVLVLLLAVLIPVASAADGGTVIGTGFNGPMGVLVAADGSLWVIDSGTGGDKEMTIKDPETGKDVKATVGDTARVVQIGADGKQTVAAVLPSISVGGDASGAGGNRLAQLNGVIYATSGGWTEAEVGPTAPPNTGAVVKIEGGAATEAAQPWKYEQEKNPDGFAKDSHPFGLAAGPDGNLWVADAGANDLLKINPASGQVDLVAVFPGLPAPMVNPARGGAKESDPVPTGVAFGKDGAIYVSLLPGAPFTPGSSKIVKVSPDGSISDYAIGLTMTTDLRAGPDGNLYAVQLAQFGEQGPIPNTGKIIRIKAGGAPEVVLSLSGSFPTSIDFNAQGDAYVTTADAAGTPGSGQVVKYAALTSAAGSPLPPPALPTTGAGILGTVSPLVALIALGLGLIGGGLVLKRRRVAEVVERKS